MKKIGLIGESPNDTYAIKNLLAQRYSLKYEYLTPRIRGDQVGSDKFKRIVKEEIRSSDSDIFIYIRDLDKESNLTARKKEFSDINIVPKRTLHLLNIHAIEALILSDIDVFNKLYKVKIRFVGNPMMESNPKRKLQQGTSKGIKQYEESHCPEIFGSLRFDKIQSNCKYFKDFVRDFEKVMA